MVMQSRIERAMEYVHTNWQTGESLKQISSRFSVDPPSLARVFRNTHGITVKRFIDAERAKVVRALLRSNNIPGYKVAKEIGMDDLTFYRWVKRVFGKSLKELKKK